MTSKKTLGLLDQDGAGSLPVDRSQLILSVSGVNSLTADCSASSHCRVAPTGAHYNGFELWSWLLTRWRSSPFFGHFETAMVKPS